MPCGYFTRPGSLRAVSICSIWELSRRSLNAALALQNVDVVGPGKRAADKLRELSLVDMELLTIPIVWQFAMPVGDFRLTTFLPSWTKKACRPPVSRISISSLLISVSNSRVFIRHEIADASVAE